MNKLLTAKMNLFEISHRDIELIERKRHAILNRGPDQDADECIEEWEKYILNILIEYME